MVRIMIFTILLIILGVILLPSCFAPIEADYNNPIATEHDSYDNGLTMTTTQVITHYFPFYINGSVTNPLPSDVIILGDMGDYDYLVNINGGRLPPDGGYNVRVGDDWNNHQLAMNTFYHPSVNLVTQFPFGDGIVPHYEVLNPHTHKKIASIFAPNQYQPYLDVHDLQFNPSGDRVIMTIYYPSDQNHIVRGNVTQLLDIVLIEMNWPELDTITFEWHGKDHLNPNLAYNDMVDGQPYSYAHVNSLEYSKDGTKMLVSARHTSQVFQIDMATGLIDWKLGGKDSDYLFPDDKGFKYQHSASYTHYGVLLYDNQAGPIGDKQSRIVEYELVEYAGIKEAVKRMEYVTGSYNSVQGSVTRLDDTMINETTVLGLGSCRNTDPNCPLLIVLDKAWRKIGEASMPYGITTHKSYRANPMPKIIP